MTTKRSFVLSPEKRAVLVSLLQHEGLPTPLAKGIPRRSGDGPVRLSFSQERVWFLEQLQPGSLVHNIPAAFRLPGPLNIRALELSINEVVRRHEVLRTIFQSRDGQPEQVIVPELKVELPLIDLRETPAMTREMEAYRLATEEALRPFDLMRGPMLRTTLLRLADMDHVLLLTLHHIVSDGWSMGIIWSELAALYRQHSTGLRADLPELPIQYADFAEWQRAYLQGEVLESHLEYWRKQLAGAPDLLMLPTDRKRPANQRFTGSIEPWAITRKLAAEVKILNEREGATLFMTLLAAFKALLYRYTAQSNLVVGTPIANRTRTETEGLIGFFVNMLVLRTDFSGNPTFREALARVREVTLGAYAHQDLPFEKLVMEMQPERNLSHNPLFQVMFVFQNVPNAPQFTASPSPPATVPQAIAQAGTATAKFDLTLFVVESDQGIAGAVEYNTDLFDAATIKRLVSHFQLLLEAVVANPDQPLSEVNLLTDVERRQFLFDWNSTDATYPSTTCIHQLFEMQAAEAPLAIALKSGDRQLTYSELDRRANYLAALLAKAGVGPETCVGILAERSFEAIIGLLGILKAGGAYVALEPAHPPARNATILSDCKARVLLTQLELTDELRNDRQVINLDGLKWTLAEDVSASSLSQATEGNLACVLYTSGPDGPIGICVTHQAIARMAFDARVASLGAADRVLQLSGLSSSASLFEIWGGLLKGAQLALVKTDPSLAPRQFATEVAACEISVMILRTALFNYLSSEVPRAFGSLRALYITGEPADTAKVKEVLRRGAPIQLINGYGLSECTGIATCDVIEEASESRAAISVGRPVANTRAYILDKSLQPVPVGVVGELCVGGAGVARGYLNRPDLTAESFIPDPFNKRAGARLCKTGDRARYLADGRIELVHRADRRTKMSGFRVELREIETALEQYPEVTEVFVLTAESSTGGKRLTAYLVTKAESEPAPAELRRFLRSNVPDYMLPSDFIMMNSLPRTADGSLDVAALPVPETERPPLEESFVAPRTPIEKELTRIWSQVFALGKIGIRDNFFHMGGHSLLATQVISRARDAFQVELPVRHLFESPTIEGLAKYIETVGSRAQADLSVGLGENDQRLNHLDDLSEDEVDSLLRQTMEEQTRVIDVPDTSNRIERQREGGLLDKLDKLDELPADEVNSLLDELLAEEMSK